jgi:hypothetical protein
LDVILAKRHIIYYREGSGASSQRLQAKLVLEVVLIKFIAPLPFNLH